MFRKVDETRRAVIEQLILSTKAASEKTVKEAVTNSGVKDSFATPTITKLIQMGKILRRAAPGRKALTKEEVNQVLTEELKRNGDDSNLINLLPVQDSLSIQGAVLESSRSYKGAGIPLKYISRYSFKRSLTV